jgi:hypothetical protein
MTLRTNSNSLAIPVTLGNGKTMSMRVGPGEVWYNENGYVQLFSLRFNDGTIGNFLLQRKGASKNQILEFFKKNLVPLGLKIAGGVIQEKHKEHPNIQAINVAVYLGEKFGPGVVGRILDEVDDYLDPPQWGYYEIASGEHVIVHAVQIQIL